MFANLGIVASISPCGHVSRSMLGKIRGASPLDYMCVCMCWSVGQEEQFNSRLIPSLVYPPPPHEFEEGLQNKLIQHITGNLPSLDLEHPNWHRNGDRHGSGMYLRYSPSYHQCSSRSQRCKNDSTLSLTVQSQHKIIMN